MKENECSCNICKQMCKTVPCIGTPIDIMKIVDAGLEKKLTGVVWAAGMKYGIEPIKMVQPIFENGKCTFLDENDLCELHDLGLKPTEGKLANCNGEDINTFQDSTNYKVAMTWKRII